MTLSEAPAPTAARRRIGASPLQTFPIALNGAGFGWTADDVAADAVLDAFVDRGGELVDTADSYAAGRSETMIGNWMRRRRNRDRVVIATKVGRSADHPGLRARVLTRAVHESLNRLQTGHIDLLTLEVDDRSVAFEETLLAVDELIRAGKVRCFGGSDHSGDRLIEARIASAQLGVAPMAALQRPYSLVDRRQVDGDLAGITGRFDVGIMPRSPLAGGFLAGQVRTRADLRVSGRRGERPRVLSRRNLRILSVLDDVAAEHDIAVATAALAWVLSRPGVVAPVVAMRDESHVEAAMAAPGIRFTRSQSAELERVSR